MQITSGPGALKCLGSRTFFPSNSATCLVLRRHTSQPGSLRIGARALIPTYTYVRSEDINLCSIVRAVR